MLANLSTAEILILEYVALQFFSAAIQSMPPPSEYGGVWYKAFYNFASIIIGDFKSYVSKNPSISAFSQTSTSTTPTPWNSSSSILTPPTTVTTTTEGVTKNG